MMESVQLKASSSMAKYDLKKYAIGEFDDLITEFSYSLLKTDFMQWLKLMLVSENYNNVKDMHNHWSRLSLH